MDSPALMIVDAIFHGLVEQSPPETAVEFYGTVCPRSSEKSRGGANTIARKIDMSAVKY